MGIIWGLLHFYLHRQCLKLNYGLLSCLRVAVPARLLDRVAVGWIELEHTSFISMGCHSEIASVGLGSASTATAWLRRSTAVIAHCELPTPSRPKPSTAAALA